MAAEELLEYLPYIYHPKIVADHEKSYHKVKGRIFAHDNKSKCQIKIDHSSTHFSLAASAILYRNLPSLPNIVWRDSRASKIGRCPIKHTGIVLPLLAALLLAQTNRLTENQVTAVESWHPQNDCNALGFFFFTVCKISIIIFYTALQALQDNSTEFQLVLQSLSCLPVEELLQFSEDIVNCLPSILGPTVPRKIIDLVKKVWFKLHSLTPRRLVCMPATFDGWQMNRLFLFNPY